jgi:membrane-bound metal-dependent hydrolase YbcI (DUF457 family)
MQGTSHIIVGAAAAVIVNSTVVHFTNPALTPAFLVVVAANVIGSLGPDLDSGESTLRRATGTNRSNGIVGRIVDAIMPGHRGIMHSWLLAVGILLTAYYFGFDWAIAAAVGWAAHILADGAMGFAGVKNGGIAEYIMCGLVAFMAWRAL